MFPLTGDEHGDDCAPGFSPLADDGDGDNIELWIFETEYRASEVLVRRLRMVLSSCCAASFLSSSSSSSASSVLL